MNQLAESLYAQPSFIEGWGRILDFGNNMTQYNDSLTPSDADYYGLASDWVSVGTDLHDALVRQKLELAAQGELPL